MGTTRRSPPRVYLAGPDVFSSKLSISPAIERQFSPISACRGSSLSILSSPDEAPRRNARAIFKANRQLIDSCQAVLANVTPLRGPSADVGMVWEIGYACRQGKPVAAYSHGLSIYREKVFRHGWSQNLNDPRDTAEHEIENSEGLDNLLITESVGGIFGRFEDAAVALKRVFNQVSEGDDLQ